MIALVLCNGGIIDYTYYKKYFNDHALIICADGGAAHARNFGIIPHVLIGDFDSVSTELLEYFKDLGTEIIRFPVEKDMTDTELAVELAISKGCKTIIFIGGLGTRMDHSLSNVLMLKRILDKGVKGTIVNEYNEITIINDKISLDREAGWKVSLIPLSERVEGVTTNGLAYPLEDAVMELGSSLGISNEFASDVAEVRVRKGLLLVIKAKD